jgi:hypothetical protein
VKDFAPVTLLGKGGQIMVVNPNVPAKTVGEFIALAKKQPGKLSFGSGSSSSRIAGELLQQMAGIQILHVPYKSNPLAITDLLGGQIDMMITDTATGLPQVKAGKVRALGVTATKRSPLAPDIPTIDEAGVKGLRDGLLVRGVRAGEDAARGGEAPAGAPRGRDEEREREGLLRKHGHGARHLHARGAWQVPDGRVGEVGPHHQGGEHHPGVSAAGAQRLDTIGCATIHRLDIV